MSPAAANAPVALVTGGAGFIGGHLTRRLVCEGWRVRVLDDLSSGRAENLASVMSDVDLIRADVCDAEALARAIGGAEVVFHQAAIASVTRSIEEPERTHAVNLGGTLAVLEAARRAGVRRVVFAGSAAVYGDAEGLPRVESMPPRCLSPYALQKSASEGYLALYHALHGLETISLRYFNVYGARQDPESDYAAVVPAFAKAALEGAPVRIYGDGEQTRDFVHVDDVVEANRLAAREDAPSGIAINVASGLETSVNDLVGAVGRCVGREIDRSYAPPRAGDVRRSCADIGRARAELHYSPAIGLEQGLAATLEAFGCGAG